MSFIKFTTAVKYSMFILVFMLGCTPSNTSSLNVTVGGIAKMPCGLQDEPLEDQILYLQKGQLVLFELKYGTPITEHLNPQYLNRTWKDPNSLSVFFKGIQINDEGEYNCIVLHKTRSGHSKTHSSTITLNTFKDFSVPVIIKMTSDSYLNCGVPINLTCISSQGYPEDTLSWDIKAKNATWQDCEIIKTEAVRDPHTQLFNLTSVMQISLTKTLTICCSVRNSSIVMEVKCNDTVRIDPIVPPPSSRHATGTGIAVCFFVLLLIGIIIRKVVQQGVSMASVNVFHQHLQDWSL